MAKLGEVHTFGTQVYEYNARVAVNGTETEEVSIARSAFSLSWPDTQNFIWAWVWQNRKMVIFKVWLWEWTLSKIRGKVFEKAFGPCPFNWKTGPATPS